MAQARAASLTPRALLVSVLAAGSLVAACGSRGPLDIEIVQGIDADAQADVVDAAANDAAPDVDAAEASVADAPHEASLVDCGACLAQQCGQTILKCVQQTACRDTLQCATQKCFATGDTSPACLLQCSSDPTGLLPIVSIVTCITTKCGTDCTAVLGGLGGGLGGLGGGGGGGGGRRDGGR